MKAVVISVLLCLLSALVEAHSQIVPYISFMGTNLTNHSYINLTLVGDDPDGSDSVQCHTDLITCCSSTEGHDRGDWFNPSGARLPFAHESRGLFEDRQAQHIRIRRRGNSYQPEGIYCCDIETSNNSRETIYIGLYASGGQFNYTHIYRIM